MDSPSSRHGSPYERKKERLNNDVKIQESQNDSDWSQHVSSSGKIYYYNRKTEESQWEIPKDWKNKEKQLKPPDRHSKDSRESRDSRDSRDSRLSRDSDYNNKDYEMRDRDRDRYIRDRRDYRDARTIKEKDTYNSSKDRERYREREREYRDNGTSNTNGRYRNSNSVSGNSRYGTPGVKSIGHSTPSSCTSGSGRHYHQTPESVNGTVQDISPPGTPTNDDMMNLSNISVQTPAAVYTPHGCSPLLNNSLTPVAAAVAPHLVIPTTPHSPLLSPNLMLNPTNTVSSAFLHPLQQALLLHQQQQIPPQILTQAAKDVIYNSPKLPTIKNQYNDRSGSCPTSPLVANFYQNNVQHSSPTQRSMHSNNSTPPPPPPPPKDQTPVIDSVNRHERYQRLNSSFDGRHSEIPKEISNRSKSHDSKLDDTPIRPSNYLRQDFKHTSDKPSKKSTVKLFGLHEQQVDKMFDSLPDLDKYTSFYSGNIVDFTQTFYGNVLEKQALDSWNDCNGSLHIDRCKSKNKQLIEMESVNYQDTKLEISSSWYNALNDALTKMECLRDNLTSTRNSKTSSIPRSKSKQDLNNLPSSPTPGVNSTSQNNYNSLPNGIKENYNCDSTTSNFTRTNENSHESEPTNQTPSQSEQVR